MGRPLINVKDAAAYSHGYNGTALKCIIVRGVQPGQAVSAKNIAARAVNFSYNVATPVTQADEINTPFVKETNHGRQEIVTGRFDSVFTLEVNDQMPSFQTLRTDEEYTILEVSGDDHPLTDQITKTPTILNAFTGARVVNQSSSTGVNQQKMLGVDIIARKHYTGAEWALLAGSSVQYPAEVRAA